MYLERAIVMKAVENLYVMTSSDIDGGSSKAINFAMRNTRCNRVIGRGTYGKPNLNILIIPRFKLTFYEIR